jgi:hypothetical protein
MIKNNKIFAIFVLSFGLPGLGLLLGSFFAFNSTQNFLEKSVTATGTVIDLRLEYSEDSNVYYPLVKFQTENGKEIKFKSSFGTNPPAYQVGEEVSIIYLPDNPNKAQINSFWSLWFLSILLLGMGTVFTAIGFGFLWWIIFPKKNQAWLLNNGQKLNTKLVRVQKNTAAIVNGQYPYKIISQWVDPKNNTVHVFESENIWYNPEEFINSENIQTIPVYVEPKNHQRYYMDISLLSEKDNDFLDSEETDFDSLDLKS